MHYATSWLGIIAFPPDGLRPSLIYFRPFRADKRLYFAIGKIKSGSKVVGENTNNWGMLFLTMSCVHR